LVGTRSGRRNLGEPRGANAILAFMIWSGMRIGMRENGYARVSVASKRSEKNLTRSKGINAAEKKAKRREGI
jgi:hypothetical protein